MIENITNLNSKESNHKLTGKETSCDIHNISPNELDRLTLEMFKKGEISLKDRLPFVPLDTNHISGFNENRLELKYYSRVWNDGDRKRDMMLEFNNILKAQVKDCDDQMNIDFTRNAISILEKIEKMQSFESILKENLMK